MRSFTCAHALFLIPEIVGISGEERRMEWEKEIYAPQYGIGKNRLRENGAHSPTESGAVGNPKPARADPVREDRERRQTSTPSIADLVERGWSYRITHETKTHAIVEFTSPVDANVKRTVTILRGMLPEAEAPKRSDCHGRPVLRPGKTARKRENGTPEQHRDNQEARRERNREHAHGGGK